MTSFQQERIADVWDEAEGLVAEHQLAVGRRTESVDRTAYDAPHMLGFTLRVDGELKGYATFYLGAAAQQPSVMQAIQDALYVRPEVRGAASGKFLLWVEAQLRKLGAQKVTWLLPSGARFGWLTRLGYSPEYTAFSRSF